MSTAANKAFAAGLKYSIRLCFANKTGCGTLSNQAFPDKVNSSITASTAFADCSSMILEY
jgi:hypothetical protein